MPVLKDITGKAYGHFVVKGRAKSITLSCGSIRTQWFLQCQECYCIRVFMTRDLSRNRWIKCTNCQTRTALKGGSKNG